MTLSKTLLATCFLAALSVTATAGDICKDTAKKQKKAADYEMKEEFNVKIAAALNLTDKVDAALAVMTAREELKEAKQLAKDQYDARLDLCKLLGGGAYDPVIDPADFEDDGNAPNAIDNPYLPWPVGARWTYESETDEGTEVIEIEVLADTREILGVECVSVQDIVYLDGEPIEDTIDWYAQDDAGNVWYFGEISFNYEDGFVENIDGSWLSGLDGAKPGIVMLGNPTVGTTYRQEWLLGEAEDAATVEAINETVVLDIGTFMMCVKTHDFLPPEPDASEHKYYAPGIGFIYETKDGSAEVVELVSYSGL